MKKFFAWINERPMITMAVLTTIAAMGIVSAPQASASSLEFLNRAADIMLRYNHLSLGGLFGYWLYWFFCERSEPKVKLEPWSVMWFEKRKLMAAYILVSMLSWASFVRLS